MSDSTDRININENELYDEQKIIDEIQAEIDSIVDPADLLEQLKAEKFRPRKRSDLIKELMIKMNIASPEYNNDQFSELLIKRFNNDGIKCSSKTIKSWFDGKNKISRDKLIQLCISLGANYDQTKELLEQTGEDPFNYRNSQDAIYLYCIHNKKPYSEGKWLLENFPKKSNNSSKKIRIIDKQPHSGDTTNDFERFETGKWENKESFLNTFLIPNKDRLIGFSFNTLKEFYYLQNNAFIEVIIYLIDDGDSSIIEQFNTAYIKHANKLNLSLSINENENNCHDIAYTLKRQYENKDDLQSILIFSDFLSEVFTDDVFLLKALNGLEAPSRKDAKLRNHKDYEGLDEVFKKFPSKQTWHDNKEKGDVSRKSIILLFFIFYFYQIMNSGQKKQIINSDFIIKLHIILKKCRMPKINMKNQFDYLVIACVNHYSFFDPDDFSKDNYSNAVELFNEVLYIASNANPDGF